MIKFKIFYGEFPSGLSPNGVPADIKANEWIKEHHDIGVISMQYQQARYGAHSICIMYQEKEK